jgi:DNA-binding transcriptional LysR family regulator
MVPDPLAGLWLFVSVAEKRSFTAAAKALGVTPSAVSQGITALEERLGVRLLQRTTRAVGLTEIGELFLARLGPALADVSTAFATVDELRDRPAGTLRIDMSRVAWRRFIEPRLREFLEKYPDIAVDIVLDDGFADIVQSGVDAGIRLGESLDPDMVAVRISPDERVAVVGSPAYFAARGRPKHPRDLHAHDCIRYRRLTRGDIYRWEFTDERKDFEVAVSGRIIANDGEVMIRAAVDGSGLAYVLESMVTEELRDKRLVRVLADFCPPFPGHFLYYPSRTHVAPKLAVFVDFLRMARQGGGRQRTK